MAVSIAIDVIFGFERSDIVHTEILDRERNVCIAAVDIIRDIDGSEFCVVCFYCHYFDVIEIYGIDIGGITFEEKANNDFFLAHIVIGNHLAEMYVNAKRYITEHGINGIDDKMKEELKATRYELSAHDKVQLIKKDDIRLILKRSPDSADSFALTFAMADMPRGLVLERKSRQGAFME